MSECYLHVFQKLLHFGVVFSFDLLLVEKIFLLAFMFGDLEAMAVEGVFILISRDIVDNDVLGYGGALVGIWFTVAPCLRIWNFFYIFER